MNLILWRHAQAEDLTGGQLDADRQLTAKGRKQAETMATWLNSVLPSDCKILVSPSQRTIQTAQALGRSFTLVEEVGTQSSVAEILKVCHWPHGRESVLIVGHQPQLGQVVTELIPAIFHCAIRKGNVWWIGQKPGEKLAVLNAVMSPEALAKVRSSHSS